MTIGRPTKCSSIDQLNSCQDGDVFYSGKSLYNLQFCKEKDLSAYIMENAGIFCEKNLGDKLIAAHEDYPITPQISLQPRTRRVDILLECKNKVYIVELKNPTHASENRAGIGQILDYGREFSGKKEMLLISTKFDINTARTIKHYSLPIRYFYISKDHILEYMGDA